MAEIMDAYQGIVLAAPQVGVLQIFREVINEYFETTIPLPSNEVSYGIDGRTYSDLMW